MRCGRRKGREHCAPSPAGRRPSWPRARDQGGRGGTRAGALPRCSQRSACASWRSAASPSPAHLLARRGRASMVGQGLACLRATVAFVCEIPAGGSRSWRRLGLWLREQRHIVWMLCGVVCEFCSFRLPVCWGCRTTRKSLCRVFGSIALPPQYSESPSVPDPVDPAATATNKKDHSGQSSFRDGCSRSVRAARCGASVLHVL